MVASGGTTGGAGDWGLGDTAGGWMPKNPFGAGTGVDALGGDVAFGVLSPKKPPGVTGGGVALTVEGPKIPGEALDGVERGGRGVPAKGIFPTFEDGLGAGDPNDKAERGGVLGLAGLEDALGSSIDSGWTGKIPKSGLGDAGRGLREVLSS